MNLEKELEIKLIQDDIKILQDSVSRNIETNFFWKFKEKIFSIINDTEIKDKEILNNIIKLQNRIIDILNWNTLDDKINEETKNNRIFSRWPFTNYVIVDWKNHII